MTARLFCKTGELAGNDFRIENEATIGKDTTNQIVIGSGLISGNHARIFYDENLKTYVIEDLKSRNGTKLDGMRVQKPEKLGPLHVITFSDAHDFIFQASSGQAAKPVSQAAPVVSGTIADTDMPMMAMNLQPSGQPSKTMADYDVPSVPTALSAGGEMKAPRTMMESDMPQLPPGLEQGGPMKAPRTMMEADMPQLPPGLEKGGPMKTPRTMMDADLPQVVPLSIRKEDSGPPPVPAPSAPPPPKEPSVPQAFVSHQPAVRQSYVLVLEKQQQSFTLKDGENIVGRNRACDIFIDHTTVSRRHAVVRLHSGKVAVSDLGSSNHTFVDGKKVQAEEVITTYSKIKFGSVDARLIVQQFFESETIPRK